MPTISVIMSVYKEPLEWIKESIDSILNQTFKDFEFIIVNDNPQRKENAEILSDYAIKDERICILSNEVNIGLTKSLNRALLVAHGKYIARMDADDISYPTRFQKQFDFLEKHLDVGVCGANVLLFGKKNEIKYYPENDVDCYLFERSPFAHPVVMIRVEPLKKYNLFYDSTFKYAQDYELWNRFHSYTSFYNLQDVLLKYRITDKQITKKKYREQQVYAAKIRRSSIQKFLKHKGVVYVLSNEISLLDIQSFKSNVLHRKDFFTCKDLKNLSEFLYYMYRSVSLNNCKVLAYYFLSGDCFTFGFLKSMKIICYNLNKKRVVSIL